jgi:peptidoglycan-associated lipoprotein
MIRLSRAVPLAVLLAGTSLTACSRKRASEAPAPAPDTTASLPVEQPRQEAPAPVNNDDSAARERQARLEEMRRTLSTPIYFDFDQSELSQSARSTLDAKISVLNSNPGVKIRVAGNADERGSDEYNMALGQRRAATAKRYLSQRGIDEARIETASFGEERPAMRGKGETTWSQNRRDEFDVTAGEVAVRE